MFSILHSCGTFLHHNGLGNGVTATFQNGDTYDIGNHRDHSLILDHSYCPFLSFFRIILSRVPELYRGSFKYSSMYTPIPDSPSLMITAGLKGFPCGSAGKEPSCSAGVLGSIPGLGRFPEEGKGCPLQHSDLENSMYSPGGCKESDMTERLSLSL